MLTIGCHLSSSKGFMHMGKTALSIGANTFAFFTRNPRGGAAKAVDTADAAALWENIARIEAMHRDVFLESYNQMQTERLYRKERPIVWRCLNCGFVLLAKEAFRVCPVCGKDRGWAEGDIETRRLGKEG